MRNEATQFAAAKHLVTPVSGAVVLETQAQYERAGLVPEDQKQIVGTPEPSGGMLMVLSLLPLWREQRQLVAVGLETDLDWPSLLAIQP